MFCRSTRSVSSLSFRFFAIFILGDEELDVGCFILSFSAIYTGVTISQCCSHGNPNRFPPLSPGHLSTSFVATVNYQLENYNLEPSKVDVAMRDAFRVEIRHQSE